MADDSAPRSTLTDEDRAVIAELARQLRLALAMVPAGHYGTWRGNAARALDAARERGLIDG